MTYLETIARYGKILVAYYDDITSPIRTHLSMLDYSEVLDLLLELVGDGYIDIEDFERLIEYENISEFLKEYQRELRDIDISVKTRKKLLRLCLNTRNHTEITDISFSNALNINKADIKIAEDGFLQCGNDLYAYLLKFNSKLFILCNGTLNICKENDLHDLIDFNDSSYRIIPADYNAVFNIGKLMGEGYFKEFAEYCVKNDIKADNRLEAEYQAYLNNIKLSFRIRLYRPYRHICGDIANILDYEHNSKFDSEFSMGIEYALQSENALMRDVQSRYISKTPLNDRDVLEILNDNKTTHYLYRKNSGNADFTQISGFNIPLFDVKRIWGIIKEYKLQLQTDNKEAFIPQELVNTVSKEDLTHIENVLRQQLQAVNISENGKGQSLSDILNVVRVKKEVDKAENTKREESKRQSHAGRKNSNE